MSHSDSLSDNSATNRTPFYLWPFVILIGLPGVLLICLYDWLRAGSGRVR